MQNPYSANNQATRRRNRQGTFDEFDATELYCPKCGRSMPVRKKLLLVLPEGDKYEYLCGYCATSVGTKISRGEKNHLRVII